MGWKVELPEVEIRAKCSSGYSSDLVRERLAKLSQMEQCDQVRDEIAYLRGILARDFAETS